ncbi:hypothetical protein BDV19DRAFT_368575 [Aspergillus venezuelensis]
MKPFASLQGRLQIPIGTPGRAPQWLQSPAWHHPTRNSKLHSPTLRSKSNRTTGCTAPVFTRIVLAIPSPVRPAPFSDTPRRIVVLCALSFGALGSRFATLLPRLSSLSDHLLAFRLCPNRCWWPCPRFTAFGYAGVAAVASIRLLQC